MSKILLFLFAIQPILSCAYLSVLLFNSLKVTEALSCLCLVAICVHYLILGLKETLKS